MPTIMQGDAYAIPFTIKRDGVALTSTDVALVEIVLGGLRKTYPGEVTYSDGAFLFPLTQAESQRIPRASCGAQVRVKFAGSDGVVGAAITGVDVTKSLSKVVL